MTTANAYGLLTTGGYANVYYHKERQLIKKVQPTVVDMDDTTRIVQYSSIVDLATHASLDILPGLPVMLDYSVTPKSVKIYMPYYGKPLHKVVSEWNKKADNQRELRIMHVFSKLIDTCMQLEHNGIQHTDIKPSNILVNDFLQVTLIDFNILSSLRCHDDRLVWESAIGTWNYCAPEITRDATPSSTSMVWSLGLILAYMYAHIPLLDCSEESDDPSTKRDYWIRLFEVERQRNPQHLDLSRKHKYLMPTALQNIYAHCMQWDPDARCTLYELRTMLHLYRTSEPPLPILLHTVTWPADPTKQDPITRQDNIELIHHLCKKTDAERVLVLMISWMDRLPYDEINVMDIAALYALAIMLLGNYLFDDVPLCNQIVDILDIPSDMSVLIDHIFTIGQALEWRLWEKTTDVALCEMGIKNAVAFMKHKLLHIRQPYTLADLAMSTI